MKDACNSNGVTIYNSPDFISSFFNKSLYRSVREDEKFGSAVDIFSGRPDQRPYIPVAYEDVERSKSYDIEDISNYLYSGKNVILTGSFGSGKSRCYKEVFQSLSERDSLYVVSIDLRDVGALASANQIIRAHFENIALDDLAEPAVRLLNKGKLIILLDGFDEMGGAQWSDDPQRLKEIRRRTLQPVREIVDRAHSVFISGRDHYFNSDDELIETLGILGTNHLHLTCKEEFSDSEIRAFLDTYNIKSSLPDWLPRRPLLYQIVVELQNEGYPVKLDNAEGNAELWDHIYSLICKREARINTNFEESIIRDILKRLGRLSRNFRDDVEPVTLEDLKAAYKFVRGYEPADEDAVLLQKLPGLGRISYDSKDRRFVDKYLIDGLRGTDLSDFIASPDEDLAEREWLNGLSPLGLSVVGKEISEKSSLSGAISLAKRAADRGNSVLASDLVSAAGFSDYAEINCGGVVISGAEIRFFDLSSSNYNNLFFDSCIFHRLHLADYEVDSVEIRNSIVEELVGVSNLSGVPEWVSDTEIHKFDEMGNIASIKNLKLSPPQRILCVILHKTFFQVGRGRKEEALLRGLGQVDRNKNIKEILRILIRNDFITKEKGREGPLYVPIISMKPLASKIINLQTQCGEVVWEEVSRLR